MSAIKPIDRFVGALHRDHADELLFESGRPVRVKSGAVERTILAQDVRTDQIENLVREIIPPDCARIFEDAGEVSFPYAAPTGAVLVHLIKRDKRLLVVIRPYSAAMQRRQEAPPETGRVVRGTAAGQSPQPTGRPKPPPEPGRFGIPLSDMPPVATVALKADLEAYVESHEAKPMELDMQSVAPPPDVVAKAEAEVQRKATLGRLAIMTATVATPGPTQGYDRPRLSVVPAVPVDVPPGPHAIDAILRVLVSSKGSDLHLTAQLAPLMRKDGDITPIPGHTIVLNSQTIASWLMEIAPALSRDRFKAKNDADYAYEIPGLARFRVNAFRDRRGVGGVLRVIPSAILTADQLKLPPVVRDLCHLDKGLVVVTGPTGSGKSTTLAGMIDLINKTRTDHIITIEDPVEFVHEPQRCLVNQREIHSHTESFSAALRAALREDPDIVLVGEMRDLETVSIAIETAETGHLVFGTLHTNTAVSTVDRIIDQFPPDRQAQVRVMLSESLKGVIAQTLCKKIGGGRVAALEILIGVPAVANMIREGKTFQMPSMMQTGKAIGMQTLNDALLTLVKDGMIESKEAFRRAVARVEMRSTLERAGYKID